MNTKPLEKFAQHAHSSLQEQIGTKLHLVLAPDSAPRRENPSAMQELEKQIRERSSQQVIEQVAYTWFNRFCALRFMDVNDYTTIGLVSPAAGQFQPEILADAKMGHMDEEMVPAPIQQRVTALLNGATPSQDPQSEAYRLLLVAACNHYHHAMPFLFERIDDYTELLMPDDLLSGNSILAYTREAMPPDLCQDVEVMGWLYQFYISEKKDAVFAALKKNVKISAANIPAATQLFTPNWIVRYLVENSLGRLWLLNRPNSPLAEQMDYYIAPEQPETDFLQVSTPEELSICDPACGSGHMLVYAFDLLYEIYAEEGYPPSEIAGNILAHNLVGIEIDERAGAIAAFALTMKARAKQRRFLRNPVQPMITVLRPMEVSETELKEADWFTDLGTDLTTIPAKAGTMQDALRHDLALMAQIDNIGSLLQPQLTPPQIEHLRQSIDQGETLFDHGVNDRVCSALEQLAPLVRKYHVVVANPPYMGGKGINDELKNFATNYYSNSKSDLFAMFIEQGLYLTKRAGLAAMVTMQSWMFLSSYEKLRDEIVSNRSLKSLIQIGYNSFPELNSKVAQACAFVIGNSPNDPTGSYINLNDVSQSANKEKVFLEKLSRYEVFWVNQADFQKIPGSPLAYWVSEQVRYLFEIGTPIGEIAAPRKGNTTTNNDKFLRFWPEVSLLKMAIGFSSASEINLANKKWVPYNKGGGYRKWYGLNEYLVNWQNNGQEIKQIPHSVIANEKFFFRPGLTWSTVTSSKFSLRSFGVGFIFDNGGCSVFGDEFTCKQLLSFMNSKIFTKMYSEINPSLNFQSGDVAKIPYQLTGSTDTIIHNNTKKAVDISSSDWNAAETSWDYLGTPLLDQDSYSRHHISATYFVCRSQWKKKVAELRNVEIENNRLFIEACGLQDELTPDVPLAEITLTCNPHYRYGKLVLDEKQWASFSEKFSNAAQKIVEIGQQMAPDADVALVTALEQRLLADTMAEFISYAIGCMFGRYSLDKPGLILANQGQTVEDYLRIVRDQGTGIRDQESGAESPIPSPQSPVPTFMPDADNVLPILDGDWFEDDIVGRFRDFLRVTFGDESYAENLAFIEAALGRDIRSYFLKEFYRDHIKRYKKRPIYWLFSSPKGSFNALIYMHRYRPDTISIVLNEYLRDFRAKLTARRTNLQKLEISATATQREKTNALKEIAKLAKTLDELTTYEDEILYPLATQQIPIYLDDGVKVNYNKFTTDAGSALKKVPGLSK